MTNLCNLPDNLSQGETIDHSVVVLISASSEEPAERANVKVDRRNNKRAVMSFITAGLHLTVDQPVKLCGSDPSLSSASVDFFTLETEQ